MVNISKILPSGKQILKNIYLSFYYGAKIGIIGVNGSGKSTLLKIMAGIDTEFQGEAWIEAGRTGYVSVQALPDRVVEGKVSLAVTVRKRKWRVRRRWRRAACRRSGTKSGSIPYCRRFENPIAIFP